MSLRRKEYLPRFIDTTVERYLKAFGAVEIAGTMWSGKTWTSEAHGSSKVSLDNPEALSLARIDPSLILAGERPHIIDEWQEMPPIWDTVRHAIDDAAGQRGLFILTGSSAPAKDKVRHSGSGRIARVHMRPMSLAESGHSDSTVSLSGLFEGRFENGPTETDLAQLSTLICRGGWPSAHNLDDDSALLVPTQYLDTFLSSSEGKAPYNPRLLRSLLVSLARNVGGNASFNTLANDVLTSDTAPSAYTRHAASECIDFLASRYIIDEIPGWDAPIKSKKRVRTKPKRCFADPSLPAALLGMNPQRLLWEVQTFGQLFEELCLRDLSIYASTLDHMPYPSLRYYRDSIGLEVDVIIELRDGRWGAIEIKLGSNKVEAATRNLLRLRDKVRENPAARNPEPSFMAVLVGKTQFKYQTPEGIYVFPLTSLTA